MPHHVDLAPVIDQFLTPFPRDPQSAVARGAERGLDNRESCELSAWCWEVSLQLQHLAQERSLHLVMMGGAPTQLRVDVRRQRGSRDGDFLTDATPSEIEALMAAFAARFAPLAPYFVPERLTPRAGVQPLAMVAFLIRVPSLLLQGAMDGSGDQVVKMEVHFRDPLLPSETLTGDVIVLSQPITVEVVRREYQIVLKLMPLADPPIGAVPSRDGDLPKQFTDLDELLSLGPLNWADLRQALGQVVTFECQEKQVTVSTQAVLDQVAARATQWRSGARDYTIVDDPYFRAIQAFQSAQIAKSARLPKIGWRARLCRITYFARCLDDTVAGEQMWTDALAEWSSIRTAPSSGSIGNQSKHSITLAPIDARWRQRFGSRLPTVFRGRPYEYALWELLGT